MKFTLINQTIIFLLFNILFTLTVQAKTSVSVVLLETEHVNWLNFKSHNTTAISQLQNLKNEKQRIIADLVILTQAFKKAGANYELEFVIAPNHKRAILMVNNGAAVIVGSDLFRNVLPQSINISSAIIKEGKLAKAIVGLTSNQKLKSVKTLKDLQKLSAVSLPNWKTDWFVMQSLNVKELHSVNQFKLALNLISRRNIDFMLIEIPKGYSPEIIMNNTAMSVVQGVKIKMPGSRHFAISKVHPLSAQVFENLEIGLSILRSENKLQTFMRDIGVLNAYSAHWTILNE
ncbi:MAG: hypothetical protein HRU38_05805 [Saccharospirillaceae bacterium]|nr:hypothetical protein [Pseudomonadales bacterium]NRB78171.1 hypothetical protein [Saccharospirillaceae bacterium]